MKQAPGVPAFIIYYVGQKVSIVLFTVFVPQAHDSLCIF